MPTPAEAFACGLRLTGRRAILLAEFARHQPLFVGIQETRLQDSAVLPDSTYWMLHSGATPAGVGGCALWVSKGLPYAHHRDEPQYIQLSHMVVTGQSYRHLNVCLDAPHLKLFIMVLHGPSAANHPISEVQAFWQSRLCELRQASRYGLPASCGCQC